MLFIIGISSRMIFIATGPTVTTNSDGRIQKKIGKISFTQEKLAENVKAFINHVQHLKPHTVKGQYIKSIAISATMSPGVRVTA